MTSLVFDAGNTRLKWGEVADGRLLATGSIRLSKLSELGLNALTSKLPINVDSILVSNVAGASFGARLSGVLGAHCGADVRFARSEAERLGLVNAYPEPRQMGVDRWVAMIGAWATLGEACLVVDAGTAVTIDAIDGDGRHLGGQILAGVGLTLGALAAKTSDLPDLSDDPGAPPTGEKLFAETTTAAMRSGAWSAVIGAVRLAWNRLSSVADDPRLILTGGNAASMLDSLPDASTHEPDLVLKGLAILLDDDA